MDNKFEFDQADAQTDAQSDMIKGIVYIRPVAVKDLPTEIQEAARGADELYAVHAENGQRLALVRNRSLAFALARQNDLAPMTVH